jgi:hypothetical protein
VEVKLANIKNEDDLRAWLREHNKFMNGVSLQWVEGSTIHGSNVGAADVIMKYGDMKVDVELKYLDRTRYGLKYTLRPSQRRFHRISMMKGGRTALLAVENGNKQMFLMRGDHVPRRYYVDDPDSGCAQEIRLCFPTDIDDYLVASFIKAALFVSDTFWA